MNRRSFFKFLPALWALKSSHIISEELTQLEAIKKTENIVNLNKLGISTSNSGRKNSHILSEQEHFFQTNTGTLVIAPGKYYFDESVKIFAENWNFDFAHATFSLENSTGIIENQASIIVTGKGVVSTYNIDDDIPEEHSTVIIENTDINIGDTLLIVDETQGSFNGFRKQNKKGEFCTVKESTKDKISLKEKLRFSYNKLNTKVYKIKLAKGEWKNLKGISAGGHRNNDNDSTAISFRWCSGKVSNISAEGSDNQSLTFDNCYLLEGSSLSAKQTTNINKLNTNYGFRFNSSDYCTAQGEFYGHRHGVDAGPVSIHAKDCIQKIPIACVFHNSNIYGNLNNSGTMAANIHAHVLCGFSNCNVFGGGVGFSGSKQFFKGGKIEVPESASKACVFIPQELHSFDHIMGTRETTVYFNRKNIKKNERFAIDFGRYSKKCLTENTQSGGVLKISGIFHCPKLTTALISLKNTGFSNGPYELLLINLTVSSKNKKTLVLIEEGKGEKPDLITLRNIVPEYKNPIAITALKTTI